MLNRFERRWRGMVRRLQVEYNSGIPLSPYDAVHQAVEMLAYQARSMKFLRSAGPKAVCVAV